jgi:5'-nucleotidase
VTSPASRLVLVTTLLVSLACEAPSSTAARVESAPKPPPPLRFTIAGTNDWHGWAQPHQARAQDGSMVDEGGLSLYASVVKQLRAESEGRLLVLDAGDVFQGTLVSNLTEGAVMVDAFNLLGMDAVAVGNHEFDYGPVGPAVVPTKPGDDPVGALKARIAQAHFPFLSANVVEASTGVAPAWLGTGTAIRDVGGVKVGLIGLSTPQTPNSTNPVNVAGLRFLPLAPAAKAAAERLRAQGAELVVVVAHAGGHCDDLKNPNDVTTCRPGEEIFAMLDQLPPGTVDVVVAGHTHRSVGHFVQGTPVIETSALGRSFGLITLELDPKTHRPIPGATSILADAPLCERVVEGTMRCDPAALASGKPLVQGTFRGKPLHKDEAMEALLVPALAKVAAAQAQSLGVDVPEALHRDSNAESALGSVTADALRQMEGADVGLLNSGGLRADLAAGPLTYGHLYETFPFDNAVATLKLNGSQLRALLVALLAKGRVPQQSGLKLSLAVCPTGLQLLAVTLSDGTALADARVYRVVLPDYLARGGDGLEAFMGTLPADKVDLGDSRPLNFRDALAADLERRKQPLTAPRPGRTEVLRGKAAHCGQ